MRRDSWRVEGGTRMEGLTRHPTKHYYLLDNRYIPAVTSLMKPLSNMEYGAVDEAVLKEAGDRGRMVHECIDLYFEAGIMDWPLALSGYMEAFQKWLDDYDPEPFAHEIGLAHRGLWYAGTADLICVMNDPAPKDRGGRAVFLADFKTAKNPVEYLTRVQLSAYAAAYRHMKAEPDIEKVAEIVLHEDGNYLVNDFGLGDAEAWRVFMSLLSVVNYYNTNKKRG